MKILIALLFLMASMTMAEEKLPDVNKTIQMVAKILLAIFKTIEIPPISEEIKTELFIYTIDDESLPIVKKFQCEDITKPNSAFKLDQNLILLFNATKSIDGKELIDNAGPKDDIKMNLVYLAYTDGKPEFTPLKELTISLIHFLRCLTDNGYDLRRVGAVENDFAVQVGLSFAIIVGKLAVSGL